MLSLSLLLLSISGLAAAQDTGIAAIEAHFTQSGIVPSLLSTFDPSAVLSLNFEGVGDVQPGQALKKEQVGVAPAITVTPANSSVSLSGNFTLTMVDADIVGADDSSVTRHWLVNFITVDGSKVSNATATPITPYAGPGPAAGSGAHRYVIILYQQPETFTPPAEFTQPTGVDKFSLTNYVKDSGLGPIVGASYITVEEGTATVSVSATSSVNSATLGGASGSGKPTGGSSTTGSSAPGASTTSPNNAAGMLSTSSGFTSLALLVGWLAL